MTDMPGDEWKELAEAARDEQDPKKLMHLIDRLNRALEEHVKRLYPRSEEPANERIFPLSQKSTPAGVRNGWSLPE